MGALAATKRGFAGEIDREGRLRPAEGAAPPLAHAGCEVLLDGFLSNRDELRARFGADRSVADEALVAEAFRRWGSRLDEHVLGEFAAVVADPSTGDALLTNDSMGLRTLFHCRRDGGIRFSTRLADLVDERAATALDDEYIADYVALGRHTSARTPYRAIERLVPGRGLWFSHGRSEELRGWELARVESRRCRDQREYDEAFRALVTEAVRAAIPQRGAVWSDLSGGLDSSSVTSIAALLGAPGLAAYSIVSPGLGSADEQGWMRVVVEHYELEWHRLDIESALPFSRLPGEFTGEPTGACIESAQAEAKREMLAEHGVTTMLSGYGGDLVLGQCGPMPAHLGDPLFERRPVDAFRGVRDWKRGAREPRPYLYWLFRGALEPALDHVLGRGRVRRSQLPPQPWITPEYLERMRIRERAVSPLAPRCRTPGRQRILDGLWSSGLAMGGVSQGDRPYEVRSPLMDRRLVEFMMAIPWDQHFRPDRDRYLQRHALEGILPEATRNRTGKGTGSRALIEGLHRSPDWLDYLTDECLMAEHGIADADAWRLAVRRAAIGQTNGDQFFMAGVAIETWLKQLRSRRRAAARTDSALQAT